MSHQPRQTSTHDKQKRGKLSLGYWSYGSQTWPIQEAIVSILLYGCTARTLTKRMEKKLPGNYTRILRTILNKSCRQHPTKQQLYDNQRPITKTIKIKQTRHAGHCWSSRVEVISDVLLLTPSHGRAKAGRPAGTCIQQFGGDTGCRPND